MTGERRVTGGLVCLAAGGLAWLALALVLPTPAGAAPAGATSGSAPPAGAVNGAPAAAASAPAPSSPARPGPATALPPPALSPAPGSGAARKPAGGPAAAAPTTTGLREPPPRPVAEIRVQGRYAHNVGTVQLFGGVDYLERRDFYISPGLRLGATYFVWEWLGLEVQLSRYFSQLNKAGLDVEQMLGVVPDSRAPTWLLVGGGRVAFGYGKMMIAGLHRSIHFEPQALVQAGVHSHDGSIGPSGLAGLGLMIHATPRWFFRLEGGVTVEIERRVTGTTTVVGFLPSLVTGGVF